MSKIQHSAAVAVAVMHSESATVDALTTVAGLVAIPRTEWDARLTAMRDESHTVEVREDHGRALDYVGRIGRHGAVESGDALDGLASAVEDARDRRNVALVSALDVVWNHLHTHKSDGLPLVTGVEVAHALGLGDAMVSRAIKSERVARVVAAWAARGVEVDPAAVVALVGTKSGYVAAMRDARDGAVEDAPRLVEVITPDGAPVEPSDGADGADESGDESETVAPDPVAPALTRMRNLITDAPEDERAHVAARFILDAVTASGMTPEDVAAILAPVE